MKTLSELGISPAPWGTYQTKKEVSVTTSEEDFGDLDSVLCRGPCRIPNARFTAAAPKLYEYLREAVVEICHSHACCGDGCKCNGVDGDCFIKQWRKALAKAAGESDAKTSCGCEGGC